MSEYRPNTPITPDRAERLSEFDLPDTLEEALGLEYSSLMNNPELQNQFMIYDQLRSNFEALIIRAKQNLISTKKAASLMAAHTLSLHKATDEEYEAARTDILTRLPNRLAFLEELEKHFQAHEATLEIIGRKTIDEYTPDELVLLGSTSYGILAGDNDSFKKINDEYGHDVGDEILTIGATRFKNCVRQGHVARPQGLKEPRNTSSTDFVARVGGEEFIAIISGVISEEELAIAGNRIVNAYNSSPFTLKDGRHIEQTISLGGTIARGDDPMKDWKLADQRAYGAKQHGRNLYIGDIIGPQLKDHTHG